MMNKYAIIDMRAEHLPRACELALEMYDRERAVVESLPELNSAKEAERVFSRGGMGVCAFEGETMVGFMLSYRYKQDPYNISGQRGGYVPTGCNAAIGKDAELLYRLMYERLAQRWEEQGIYVHSIGLYAHNQAGLKGLFTYGFGARCMDLMRFAQPIDAKCALKAEFRELTQDDFAEACTLKRLLTEHMRSSPIFMQVPYVEFDEYTEQAQEKRIFGAFVEGSLAATIEFSDEGEHFCTEGLPNICGTICEPRYRGTGLYAALLDYCTGLYASEGAVRMGVDCETLNPTALAFWNKHFSPYTISVVRRIDR